MNIGAAIKDIRKKKSIRQGVLAATAGISQTALSQIEKGKRPGIKTLRSLCKALNVSEGMIHILAIDETDVPSSNKILYDNLFPVIKDMILQITGDAETMD